MSNPFLQGASLQQIAHAARDEEKRKTEERYERARQIITESGIKVGDMVTISWEVDDRNGGGTIEHTGILEELTDTWIKITGTNRSPGHLSMGIAAIVSSTIRIDPAEKKPADDNPFLNNPFMNQG